MEPKPTHKEEVLTTLKETLLNALSTIERLQCEENVVLDRNTNPKEIDSWCIRCTDKNYDLVNAWFYGCERKCNIGYYYGIRSDNGAKDWLPFFGDKVFHFLLSDEMFYSKTGYPKPIENILQKGKEVLNSQNNYFSNQYSIIKGNYDESIITSIKRISDGNIFHVNEVVLTNNGRGKHRINNFAIVNNEMCVDLEDFPTQYEFLYKIGKLKKEVLFTTEDGVDVHKGDIIFYTQKDNLEIVTWACYSIPTPLDGEFVYFSTNEAIQEYILMNKPLLSLNDLLSVWNEGKPVDRSNSIMFELFKGIAKEKLSK